MNFCDLPQLTPSSIDFSMNSTFTSAVSIRMHGAGVNSLIFSWLASMNISLVSLDLSFNQLEGLLPEAFGNLRLLRYLDFSNNWLIGRIPKSFGNLTSMHLLDLSHNQFTGSFPELEGLVSLRELHIRRNNLKILATTFGQVSTIEILDASNNL